MYVEGTTKNEFRPVGYICIVYTARRTHFRRVTIFVRSCFLFAKITSPVYFNAIVMMIVCVLYLFSIPFFFIVAVPFL